MLHSAAVVAPVALYFYAVHPAWAWMYWVDPDKLGAAAILPLVVGHGLLVVGGWYLASLLIRRGVQPALYYVGGGIALFLIILIAVGIKRIGTAADFRGFSRSTLSIFSVKLGYAFIVSLLALFGSAIYTSIELGRDGRRVRSR